MLELESLWIIKHEINEVWIIWGSLERLLSCLYCVYHTILLYIDCGVNYYTNALAHKGHDCVKLSDPTKCSYMYIFTLLGICNPFVFLSASLVGRMLQMMKRRKTMQNQWTHDQPHQRLPRVVYNKTILTTNGTDFELLYYRLLNHNYWLVLD